MTSRSVARSRCSAATCASRPINRVVGRAGATAGVGAGPAAPPAMSRSSSPSAGDGSRPVSSTSRRRYSRPVRSASGARPVAASALICSRTAGSRSGSDACAAAASARTSSAAWPASVAQATSASVTSRCSRAHPSTATAIDATSVRSTRTGPRHNASASRSRGSASAGSRRASLRAARAATGPAPRPARRRRGRGGSRRVRSPAGPPPVRGPLRSRETRLCRAWRPDSGASSGHSASTRWSTVTTRPSASASRASTARRLEPRTSTTAPSTTTRSGPSTSTRTDADASIGPTPADSMPAATASGSPPGGLSAPRKRVQGVRSRAPPWSRRRPPPAEKEHVDGSRQADGVPGTVRRRHGRDRLGRPDGDRQPARPLRRTRARARRHRSSSPSAPATTRATSPSGCATRPPAATSATTPATGEFFLTDEQAFCLADPNGPNVSAAFLAALGYLRSEPMITEAFRTGAGVGWHEHDEDVFVGMRRVLPAGLRRRAGPELDSRAGRGRGQADRRCPDRRRRLRARLVVGAARAGLPAHQRRRLGLPRRVDRAGAARRRPRPASPTGSASRSPRRRPSPAPATTW